MRDADVVGVVDALARRESWPYPVVADWSRDRPDLLPELVAVSVDRLERGSPAVNAVVGLVGEDVLAEQVERAIRVLAGGMDPRDSQAASLVCQVSLQAPGLLAGHLRALWDLDVNGRAYYAPWPWRAARDRAERDRLFGVLIAGDETSAVRARACLMQTRDPDVIEQVLRIGDPGPRYWLNDPRIVGYLDTAGALEPLTPPGLYHVHFPSDFLRPFKWSSARTPVSHPTWESHSSSGVRTRASDGSGQEDGGPADAVRAVFGGTLAGRCPICDGPIHRLLRLDPIPPDLGVSGSTALDLATCLTCLGWVRTVLYAHHQADGTCLQLVPGGDAVQDPEFFTDPLPQADVALVPTKARWRWQDWAVSNGLENLNRVGGEPTWIQGADYPTCDSCAKTMTFLAQLDSLDFADHGEWLWGSGGVAYIFWCDHCRHSATTWQCT